MYFERMSPLTGKYNEIVQSGIEIIGIDNVRAEIECVISVIQSLQKLKVQSFTIEIGQVQLYKCIVKKLSIHEEEEEKFLEHILKVKIMPLYPILLEIRN